MKHWRVLAAVVIAALLLSTATACIRPRNEGTPSEIARRLLDYLVQEDMAAAFALFDNTMKALLPESQLATVWDDLISQFGAYTGEIEMSEEYGGKFVRIVVRSQFSRGAL
ncbi:MAG TPA: DUF3887 domain-containing protein, partial [Bacillota bacterium]|nr:DUF3887 domain-containing protein [Bacillota bacterium]